MSDDLVFLYERSAKIYPRAVDGRFQRLRKAAVFWLLGMYYAFPWFNWDGRQMVLFDLPARKFYVFGWVVWPQDFIFLAAFLVACALSLFFFTALAGRLWCGYACPQTVWTEVFLWIEHHTEGDRNARMRLDKEPMSWRKFRIKASKQALWIGVALWTGFTFVGFFTPIRQLALDFPMQWDLTRWFWTLFYGAATYGNAAYLREQVCKYMCPYARFQSAMLDRDSLIISYDEMRGEPRGARRRQVPDRAQRLATGSSPSAAELGDCIDCKACVLVCPTGIDIRKGLQYECIGCAACIDACDEVMDKVGYPRGLVRYSTENAIQGQPTHILRPRVIVYALVLLTLGASVLLGVMLKKPLIVDVIRDRGALYRFASDGQVENAYQVKLIHKRETAAMFRLRVLTPGLELIAPANIAVEPGEVRNVAVTLRQPEDAAKGAKDVVIEVIDLSDDSVRVQETTRFFGPT